ncbi:MAG TPA: DoxX family protein [Candidatus Sphingobacterium stercoripullorum]|nr:DoxX family protein [Candidatus Sphingobacterium stercoripullorum]
MAVFSSLAKQRNFGLLILRIGLGAFMIIQHGLPKLMGGPELWAKVGSSMSHLGIDFFHLFWGLSAALVETLGGVFFILGLWFRPTAFAFCIVMAVAGYQHLQMGDGWSVASRAFELLFVFFGIAFVGPGKYSVDKG